MFTQTILDPKSMTVKDFTVTGEEVIIHTYQIAKLSDNYYQIQANDLATLSMTTIEEAKRLYQAYKGHGYYEGRRHGDKVRIMSLA